MLWVVFNPSELGQLLAVLSVGLPPVLLLALLATVEEQLAPTASQGDLAILLLLPPVVHVAVCTLVPQSKSEHAGGSGHPHWWQLFEAQCSFNIMLLETGGCESATGKTFWLFFFLSLELLMAWKSLPRGVYTTSNL